MERITSKRPWDEAKEDLRNEMGYSHIWTRLNAIEDILGDDYDLDQLRERMRGAPITAADHSGETTEMMPPVKTPWARLIRKRFEQVR